MEEDFVVSGGPMIKLANVGAPGWKPWHGVRDSELSNWEWERGQYMAPGSNPSAIPSPMSTG